MESKHTPGPWVVIPTPETINGGDYQARIIAPKAGTATYGNEDGNDIIVVGNFTNKNGHGNIHWEPNANLIACAPEMLEALKEAQRIVNDYAFQYGEQGTHIAMMVSKVIAKAEGGNQ